MKNKKAVVLLSGGLDSTTTLYIARRQGYNVMCLIFDYGQRHKKEIEAAKGIAGDSYKLIRFKLPWGGSSLIDKKMQVPKGRSLRKIQRGIPSTYVPARNTIFLAFGISYAEAIGAEKIFIGANCLDYSGYPDCRPDYFKAYERLISLGTKLGKIGIEAPLLKKTKSEIIRIGTSLGVPYELTWSCYMGGKSPCGECDSCILRAKGFREAGIPDPLL